jgi:TetR/AcrR family transcriptional regulator, transcriptional repressor of bet genes
LTKEQGVGRKRNTEFRREQIIDAFCGVLAECGYAHTTMAKIAKKLGVRAGLMHYHFDNKNAILLALIQRLTALVQARYRVRLNNGDSASEKLFAYINARLARGDDVNPMAAKAWMMISAEAGRDQEVAAIYSATLRQELTLLLQLLAEALNCSEAQCLPQAHLLLTQIEGAFALAASARELMPSGFAAPMARAYLELLLASK